MGVNHTNGDLFDLPYLTHSQIRDIEIMKANDIPSLDKTYIISLYVRMCMT